MKADEVDMIERYFGPYANLPEYKPAMRLIAHCRELQAFVFDLNEHYARKGGPEKTAEHFQLVQRCKALRAAIGPRRPGPVPAPEQRLPGESIWEFLDRTSDPAEPPMM